MLISTFIAIVFGFLQIVPQGMPQGMVPDTLTGPGPAVQDSLATEEAEEQIPDTVYVWKYQFPESFEVSETDSTLRWVTLLNLFNKHYREPGAITYRMGTIGRMDGILLHAYSTRHLNLEMEGLDLNDPLTGNVNWNRLPIHKISGFYEADYGASYRSQVKLRDHYLIQPRTYLNFDESKYNHRSLEFSYTQNFLKTTNLELSFWDRRDGGGYRSSGVEGKQILAKAYHQLNHRWILKAGYINNGIDREESFGYQLTEPNFFSFNPFVESPVESNASANQSSNDIFLQIHHRADSLSSVSAIMGLHYQIDKWSLTYSADTLATSFQKPEFFARQRLAFGATELTGTGRFFLLSEKEKSNLTESSWMGGELSADLSQKIGRIFEINSHASIKRWDDNRESMEYSGRLVFLPFRWFQVSGFGGLLNRAPDIQSMYWISNEYSGSTDLANEESEFMGAQAELTLFKTLTLGARGDIRNTTNATFMYDGLFRNIDSYTLTSGTAWLELDSRIFEGLVSGTYKTYSSNSLHPVNRLLDESGERVLIKSNFYWKNYLFDRATFVKAGFSGVYSLNPFRTAEFITPLNRWQHGTNNFINPSYYRLDVDVSARIRWFMVLLKWENVLDQVEQLGYFESVGYPMPGRRFRFGIRVLFTN